LIDTVRNIKTGNKGINKELVEHDVLLNVIYDIKIEFIRWIRR